MNTFKDYLVENRIKEREEAVEHLRRRVTAIAQQVAPEHDNYDDFAKRIKKLIPRLDDTMTGKGLVIVQDETGPIYIDLGWMYDAYNPQRKAEFDASWDDYGRARAEGKYVGKGGWTGD
ncbi:MAG: hypothetical protein ACXADH_11060 [Candidatus Kariarchaeaceae archaeon]|jgi:hypothetical protein